MDFKEETAGMLSGSAGPWVVVVQHRSWDGYDPDTLYFYKFDNQSDAREFLGILREGEGLSDGWMVTGIQALLLSPDDYDDDIKIRKELESRISEWIE